jgi:hypothetical protein
MFSFTLSRMGCEKLTSMPGISASAASRRAITSSSCRRRAASGRRLQAHEELEVVRQGRIGAVLGPAELRRDRSRPPDSCEEVGDARHQRRPSSRLMFEGSVKVM